MKTNIALTTLILFLFSGVSSSDLEIHEIRHWVFFADRGLEVDERLAQREAFLVAGPSWERRVRAGLTGVDEYDLYPWKGYVAAVCEIAGSIRAESRYLNAVSVAASPEQLERILQLSFVDRITPVGARTWVPVIETPLAMGAGLSASQLAQIGLDSLHSRGWTGTGVIIGVLDSGFNLDHPAFAGINVLDQYDFLMNDPDTSQQPGDYPGQSDHGTKVLSIIGGLEENTFSGGATGASFILAKTEDISDEYPEEEDLWVLGLEWVEEGGALLVSSSLAYIDWYTWEDLDGNTAVTTIAADLAASRGMMVFNAIGNNGPGEGTLMAPADGDSVFAVGGVDASGFVAPFSSRGPTFDGRIKPDGCARGLYAVFVSSSGTGYSSGNGTSFATPLMSSVAAVLADAHPEWSIAEVASAIKATASRESNPDNSYGWGIADAYAALTYRSVTGSVRWSHTGEYIAGYPLTIQIAGNTPEVIETNADGWFALDPGVLGEYTVTDGGGSGIVIPVTGLLDSPGVEIELFVDPLQSLLEPSIYPNPSTEGIYLGFDVMAGPADAVMSIYTLTGDLIHSEQRMNLQTGIYRAPLPGEAFYWSGTESSGDNAASGTYFVRLTIGNDVFVSKFSLIR